ncbi:MAG: FtsX-like permease family protein [Gemmatimonadota bacterium]|nr:FtsX-like permease family protein [Gemmatimonadota bacterium]
MSRTAAEAGRKSLHWWIARRYLSSRRGSGFLSLITLIAIGGVAVGVMALIVVIGVMSGLQTDLREKILGANAHGIVLERSEVGRMTAWRSVLHAVSADPDVVAAAPFVYTEVGLNPPGGSYGEGAVLRGLSSDAASLAVTEIDEHLISGRMPFGETESERPGIVLGVSLADRLGLFPGEPVTVVAFQGAELTPTGIQPQMRLFEVTGIFETGLYQYDTKFAYVDLEAAQTLLRMEGTVTGVEFNVRDPWRSGEVAQGIAEELGFGYRVEDWQRQNASLFSALKLEKFAMGIILLLIVLVASFNIVSTLIMVVHDKVREIGILRAMGLGTKDVTRIFVLQGVVIGLVGTSLGTIGGLALGWVLDTYEFITLPGDVYFIDRLPISIDPLDVGIIVGASVAIALLATLYPARQAARYTPVEAIRHD